LNLRIGMGKYNKLRFTHVTLKRFTNDRLAQLKNKIRLNSIAKINCSIDEVVSFLMDFYEQNSKQEYSTEEKLLPVASLRNIKLETVIPMKKTSSLGFVKNFDRKQNVTYSIED